MDGEGDHIVGGVGREGVDGEVHQLGRGEVTVLGEQPEEPVRALVEVAPTAFDEAGPRASRPAAPSPAVEGR